MFGLNVETVSQLRDQVLKILLGRSTDLATRH